MKLVVFSLEARRLKVALCLIAAIAAVIVTLTLSRPQAEAADTGTISLQPDWNLVAWPGPSEGVAQALQASGISGRVTAIWSYEQSDWIAYFPAAANVPGANDLSTLESGTAYFIALNGTTPATWDITTSVPPTTPVTPTLMPGWHSIAPLPEAAFNVQTAALPSGTVAALGGETCTDKPGTFGDAVEINSYDPESGTWSSSNQGGLPLGLPGASVVVLANGDILSAGGSAAGVENGSPYALAYDPSTGMIPFEVPQMNTGRQEAAAVRLADGRVLLAGGVTNPGGGQDTITTLESVEIYDPVSNTWTVAAPMLRPRQAASAVLLPDGKVLVAGGYAFNPFPKTQTWAAAEVYDPVANTWSLTGSIGTDANPAGTAATYPGITGAKSGYYGMQLALLTNGKVLAIGGQSTEGPVSWVYSYDESTNAWTTMTSLTVPRLQPAVAVLPNGDVLAAGGYDMSANTITPLWSSEEYDPATDTWTSAGNIGNALILRGVAQLPNGEVLLIGGASPSTSGTGCSSAVDLFVP